MGATTPVGHGGDTESPTTAGLPSIVGAGGGTKLTSSAPPNVNPASADDVQPRAFRNKECTLSVPPLRLSSSSSSSDDDDEEEDEDDIEDEEDTSEPESVAC
mmetsp:Transcript_35857/g.73325  ORF Transcript_35857/g.73325 Transcript_35857/m.73325 type:complete len:102 (+) Transcript_35857:432-737(+)